MRVLEVRLENDDYDRLATVAGSAGKAVEEVAAEALLSWIRGKEKALRVDDEVLRQGLIKARLQDRDQDLKSIAAELGVPLETAERWDREIRGVPAEWSKAFVFASKSFNPLTWEMTVRERFYGLWGHRPQA